MLVSTGFESHLDLISVAVPEAYMALLSLVSDWLALGICINLHEYYRVR